jgi:tRNA-2-methylthio-N6-dimethylallyladenosine synthase
MFSFKYSRRPRTKASLQLEDDVSTIEKTRRIVALQAMQKDIQLELNQQAVGTLQSVLTDSRSRRRSWELSGRTTGNIAVNFSGAASLGEEVQVRIQHAGPNSLRGVIENEGPK